MKINYQDYKNKILALKKALITNEQEWNENMRNPGCSRTDEKKLMLRTVEKNCHVKGIQPLKSYF